MALGGAAVYLLLTQKNKVPGIIAAAGAVIAYKRYDDARRSYRDCNQGYGYYDNRDYQRNSDYQASSEYYANGYDSQWNRGQRWEGQEQHGMYSRDRNQHNDWENRGARAKDAHRGR